MIAQVSLKKLEYNIICQYDMKQIVNVVIFAYLSIKKVLDPLELFECNFPCPKRVTFILNNLLAFPQTDRGENGVMK